MKIIFFKVVRPVNECIRLLLFSLMRSWIMNIKWRASNSVCCEHSWDLCYLIFWKNRSQYYLFFCWYSGKIPFFVCLPSIYMIGKRLSIFFPIKWWFLSVIIIPLLQWLLFAICLVVTSLGWVTLLLILSWYMMTSQL